MIFKANRYGVRIQWRKRPPMSPEKRRASIQRAIDEVFANWNPQASIDAALNPGGTGDSSDPRDDAC